MPSGASNFNSYERSGFFIQGIRKIEKDRTLQCTMLNENSPISHKKRDATQPVTYHTQDN
jgi:hypothetical protein